jgi:SWI/SNF-related matrix-associated actin-dependent regulator of chromatin subfamily A3
MSSIALRRTKETKVNGRKLIDLPTKEIRVKHLEFSGREGEIYNKLYQDYGIRIRR